MTTIQQEITMEETPNHLRRFWIVTTLTFASVIVISLVVGFLAGAHAGRLVFFAAVASSSVIAVFDGIAVRARRKR